MGEEYSNLLAKIREGYRDIAYLFESYFIRSSIQKTRKKENEDVGQTISKIEDLLKRGKFAEKAKEKKYEEMRKSDRIKKPSYLEDLLRTAQELNKW